MTIRKLCAALLCGWIAWQLSEWHDRRLRRVERAAFEGTDWDVFDEALAALAKEGGDD